MVGALVAFVIMYCVYKRTTAANMKRPTVRHCNSSICTLTFTPGPDCRAPPFKPAQTAGRHVSPRHRADDRNAHTGPRARAPQVNDGVGRPRCMRIINHAAVAHFVFAADVGKSDVSATIKPASSTKASVKQASSPSSSGQSSSSTMKQTQQPAIQSKGSLRSSAHVSSAAGACCDAVHHVTTDHMPSAHGPDGGLCECSCQGNCGYAHVP